MFSSGELMDIILERIISLLPHKPDGSLAHGAKADFAKALGYGSGDIVSMWLKGSSTSYKKKLHEIAAVYNVSVEWLRGETDKKAPASPISSDDELREYLEMLKNRPECRILLSTVKGATKEEVEANVKLIEALRGFRG